MSTPDEPRAGGEDPTRTHGPGQKAPNGERADGTGVPGNTDAAGNTHAAGNTDVAGGRDTADSDRGRAGSARGPGRGRLNSWRVAVRIARRDAWRSKGRSLLVLAMIALPIVGVSAADITIRSSQLSASVQITRDIGAADARLDSANFGTQPIMQSPDGTDYRPAREVEKGGEGAGAAAVVQSPDEHQADPRTVMPAGSRWITDTSSYAEIRTKSGLLDTSVRELNVADPLAKGIIRLRSGRLPAAADEVAATSAFLKSSGMHVGSQVRARDLERTYTIVGSYELPSELATEQLVTLPGAFLDGYAAARRARGADVADTATPSYLVSMPGDFTWAMVLKANQQGIVVGSRAVRLHPPADSEVPLYQQQGRQILTSTTRKDAITAAATIVGLAMLEICLLAGPAFAVGARRSRRQLGLVGANGGDRRHIRAIVLSGGLVIGLAAAVVGTALGVALTVALRGTLEGYVNQRFGGLTLRPLELVGIAALAVVTGLLASIVPAVTAARHSVLSSLTGRRGIRHANRALPVVGLVAVCLGGALAVFGSMRSDNRLVVGGGSALAELGVAALTPTLVGLFGRLGSWLPLAPRLALRDAVRNRGRTAPAVAAVLAAVAGSVAVATYAASSHQEARDTYEARAPRGVYVVADGTDQGRDLPAIRAVVQERLPVSGRADVWRLSVGSKVCDEYSSQPGCGSAQPVVPKANLCPRYTGEDGEDATQDMTLAQRRALAGDWRCTVSYGGMVFSTEGQLVVGGPAVLHALGIRDGASEQALARGETVLFDKEYLHDGKLDLRLVPDQSRAAPDGSYPGAPVRSLPVHMSTAHLPYGLTALIPRQAAKDAGLRIVPYGSLFTTSRMPTSSERQALTGDLAKLGTGAQTYLERGYTGRDSVILLALMIFAAVVTVGAAAIATGLSQADAEADLRTLAAIGAEPRVRRTLSGLQCGLVAFMGVVLGTVAGVLPAIGLRRAELHRAWSFYHRQIDAGWGSAGDLPHVPIVVPWGTLVLLVLAVPVGAALLAALFTRSRAGIARRAEV